MNNIIKYGFAAFAALAATTAGATTNPALTYWHSDFAGATAQDPLTGWTCWGVDAQAKNVNVGQTDIKLNEMFPEGGAAYVVSSVAGSGPVAWSNSTTIAGQAVEQWLVSPAIDLTDATANAMLNFDVLSYGSANEARFEVYLSTTGPDRADFTEKAVYAGRQQGDAKKLVRQTVRKALKDCGGKTVWLAFVNKSTNCQLTGFADVSVAEYDFDFENTLPSYVQEPTDLEMTFKLSTMTPVSCKGFTLTLDDGHGNVQTVTNEKQLNSRYNSYTVSFAEPLKVAMDETVNYTLTFTPNIEGATPTTFHYVAACNEGYPGPIVMEEGTGAWCGYCVRGMAAINRYFEEIGDRFIPIAVHNSDVMANKYYNDCWAEQSGLMQYPSAWVNRNLSTEPCVGYNDIMALVDSRSGQKVAIDAVDYDEDTHEVTVTYSPEFSYDDPAALVNAAAVLVENDCWGEEAAWGEDFAWWQNNNFSGMTEEQLNEQGLEGWMEWLEPWTILPQLYPSKDVPFEHVAWGIYNDYYGTPQPTQWQAGVAQRQSLTFTMPMQEILDGPGVQDWANTEVIVLLLDARTGRILAADRMAADKYNQEVGIVGSALPQQGWAARRDGNALSVNAPEGVNIQVYSLQGALIGSKAGCLLPSQPVVVRLTDGVNTVVKKL